jgi:diguanylate cyclase (GGDEF)-like protein
VDPGLGTVDASIVLAAGCLDDRSGGRLVAALFVLPTLYAALFLPRWVLLPQLVAVTAGTTAIMVLGGSREPLLAAHAGIVVVSAMSPAVAVSALRAQLLHALRQARAVAGIDPLTGLVNRRGIAERAPGIVRRARDRDVSVGVLVADVDHFKRINDRHGHAVGDEVLRIVAGAVSACVRPGDVVVRLGGEELAVLAAIEPGDLAGLAERIREEVRVATARWSVTVSLGVAWDRPAGHGDPLQLVWSLLDRADDLMYDAKRAGRNRVRMPTAGLS